MKFNIIEDCLLTVGCVCELRSSTRRRCDATLLQRLHEAYVNFTYFIKASSHYELVAPILDRRTANRRSPVLVRADATYHIRGFYHQPISKKYSIITTIT